MESKRIRLQFTTSQELAERLEQSRTTLYHGINRSALIRELIAVGLEVLREKPGEGGDCEQAS